MCGIIGIYRYQSERPVEGAALRRMLGAIHHRGPDECGYFRGARLGIGTARLSIIDLSGGSQPIHNEDESLWVAFNGEIFNYLELRAELLERGHRFYTRTDTEVLVHLYEEEGPDFLNRLNGQFALAIWDARRQRLLLARDRVGIRPLYYLDRDGSLIFGSEVKSLLASGEAKARIDPEALDDIFTFWTPLPGRTVFQGIHSLPPGHLLLAGPSGWSMRPFWKISFPPAGEEDISTGLEEQAESFRELLEDAVRLRLRADVTVGAYLSGGLDSSAITALTHRSGNALRTFSINFKEAAFDERPFQEEMIAHLGTSHSRVECDAAGIGEIFPEVVACTETPVLRTAPAPMYLLSGLVQEEGIKVVLTGEGADEILCGYNLFREAKVRRFWARDPRSLSRPRLLERLYPYLPELKRQQPAMLASFFGRQLEEVNLPWYSHLIRWENTSRLKRYFSKDLRRGLNGRDAVQELAGTLPGEFETWSPLARAQYLEMSLFLSGYLLSSQGDRVMMGHSLEGRFPFLDYRVIEFASRIPPRRKLCGLKEKHLLKKAMEKILPPGPCKRPKQPYRAPIAAAFLGPQAPEYVRELLSPAAVTEAGLFDPAAVTLLAEKGRRAGKLSETEEMALAGILSAQLVHEKFVKRFSWRTIPEAEPTCRFERAEGLLPR